MKKGSHAKGLSNVFNELEKADSTGAELDRLLSESGFDPVDLEAKVKDRFAKIKAGEPFESLSNHTNKFDPLLLAASKGSKKGQDLAKKIRNKN